MGLREFPDTLLPVILRFGSDISDGSHCLEDSLSPAGATIFPSVSLPLPFDNSLYLHSLQGLVIIDLRDSFLKHPKVFSGHCKQFHKIALMENRRE
jgi:hypothetical protein